MKTMSLRRKIFYGVTLAFVATLLLLPATGWLARLQLMPWSLRLQLMPWSLTSLTLATYGVNTSEIRHASVLAKSPGDFDLRYAVALSSGGSAATKLEALNREHPKNAQILAALLRYLTAQDNNGSRPEEALLLPPPKEPQKPQEYKPFSNAARVVVLAAEAEAVEPQNGFFPAMAAVALFALREDDKAVAAWVRAGNAPDWNDYTERDATARWKLLRALHGNRETGSVMRMSTTAGGIMFPHYAKLRMAARMAAVTAMQAEIAGNANEGLRIRRATRQVGESLQKQNGSMVGNIVGSAVVSLSAARAGGAEALENPYKGDDKARVDRWIKEKQQRYAAYLRGVGQPEEASAYLSAMKRSDAIKEICKRGFTQIYTGYGAKTFQLIFGWLGNVLLLAGAIFALGFAGVFALVYRFSPRLQRNEPLQKSARWGTAMGLLLPVFLALAGMTISDALDLPDQTAGVVLCVGILTVALSPFAVRLTVKEIGHGLLVMAATVGGVGVIGGLAVAICMVFGGFASSASLLTGTLGSSDGTATAASPWKWLETILAGVMACLPLLMLALFALFSRILKIPVAAGVTRGTRSMAVPLAALLLMAWGGTLFNTLRHETAAIAEMERIAHVGEARVMAEAIGEPFPK